MLISTDTGRQEGKWYRSGKAIDVIMGVPRV